MNPSTALEFAEQQRAANLDRLIEYLSIPSIGTDPKHHEDTLKAANWLLEQMQAIGLEKAYLIPTAGKPVVYGEWLGAGPEAPTFLVYGHYDVQPTDPDDEWHSPAFEPAIRDGSLFARGASDNKGQHFAHLAAVEAYLSTVGTLPVNLKFFIEGEEEEGSPHLTPVVEEKADLLRCDAVVISDSSFYDAQTPCVGTGVRGLVYTEVEIQGPRQDLHSGGCGGVAHNPLQVMVDILAALHDDRGRVTVPGFYDKVLPLSDAERQAMGRIPFDEGKFLREEVGAPALWSGEIGYSPLERIGARPTLEIHGIRGGYVGPGQKTVIPAQASAKVSMRLVPDQEPEEIARLFEAYIHELAPKTVEIKVNVFSGAEAAVMDSQEPVMQQAAEAIERGFGATPVFLRGGGTLPIVADFLRVLEVPVVLMGFGLPDDNLHSPNEKFKLDNFYRGIDSAIHFFALNSPET